MKNDPTHTAWQSMRQRCNNPKSDRYSFYGGRGIRVCDRWNASFDAFLADMGARPPKRSLDRIDVDGNYEPGNCRWATQSEQMRNMRITRRVTIDGRTYVAKDLAERIGVKTDTIVARAAAVSSLDELMSTERRVFTPGLALGGIANGVRQKSITHCPAGHEYAGRNLYVSPKGFRGCRACKAKKQLERTARKRA